MSKKPRLRQTGFITDNYGIMLIDEYDDNARSLK